MTNQFHVDPAQLHRHAANLLAIRDQLSAIRGASGAIVQDSAAYGLLCQWISGILEGRHQAADELFAMVDENLRLVAASLKEAADGYEATDQAAADRIAAVGRGEN